MNQNHDSKVKTDSNLHSITGGSGSHPVGTGVGAAGGAVAGAAIGTAVGGPVGAVVGGAIGAATGALAGHGAAEAVNPTVEEAYWSENYLKRDYVERNRPYADYRPAYQYGWESRARMGNRPFHDVENDLERGWELAKGESKLAWMQAKHATSDAWYRIAPAKPVDAARR
jgi:phage tail tape-measure protein